MLLWALVAGLAGAAMIPLEPDLLEEGMIVHFAQRMAHGEHLYRDLVFFSGPLPFELLSLLFRIFGEEIVVGRWTIVVLMAGATAATFGLAQHSRSGALAHVVAAAFAVTPVLLFPLASIFFYSALALALAMPAAFAALRGLEDRRWAIAAGALAACVALTKQSVGIVLGPGLVLAVACLARPGLRRARALDVASGGLAVTVLTLAVYGLRGDLGVFWHSMVVMPLSLGTEFGSPYPNLWPIGELAEGIRLPFYAPHLANLLAPWLLRGSASFVVLTQLLYALPFLALLVLFLRRMLRGAVPAAIWMVAVVLLAFLAQLFPRSDWGHLAYVLPPAFFVLVTGLGSSRDDATRFRSGRRSPLRRAAPAFVACATILLGSGGIALALHRASGPATLGPRVPQRVLNPAYRRPDLGRAIAHLRSRVEPSEPIFVARAEPLVYFATGTRNPTPYAGIIPGLGEEQDRTIIEALESVRFVAMSERDSDQFFYYRDELPLVQRYLERHFRVAKGFEEQWGWMLVLERGEDRGPTAIDLLAEVEGAVGSRGARIDPWMRDRDGRERPMRQPIPRLATRLNRRPLGIALGPLGGGIDVELTIPDQGAIFEAGVGLPTLQSGDRTFVLPRGARFELHVDRGDGFELLEAWTAPADRRRRTRWTPFEADLSAFAGETLRLRLAVTPRARLTRPALAWWGGPRLVARDDAQDDASTSRADPR
jgi:hypothetical protein